MKNHWNSKERGVAMRRGQELMYRREIKHLSGCAVFKHAEKLALLTAVLDGLFPMWEEQGSQYYMLSP